MNLKEKAEKLWGRLKGDTPELFREAVKAGVATGLETVLEAHGIPEPLAAGAAREAGALVKIAEGRLFARVGRHMPEEVVVRVAFVPDTAVTPCRLVYAVPVVHGEANPNEIAAVAPHVWVSGEAALVYARDMSRFVMGLKKEPLLVDSGGWADADRLAWETWRDEHRRTGLSVNAEVPTGPYVLGKLDDGQFIAWRLVLHPAGMRVGCLAADGDCSLTSAPTTFDSPAKAAREVTRRGHPFKSDVVYLPASLRAELRTGEDGRIERIGETPQLVASDPVRVQFARRVAPDPDPLLLGPDWYASRDAQRNAWAWRPVGEGSVSFARAQGRDGAWGTVRWPSVGECLEHLGRLGLIGQEHPTLTAAPEMAMSQQGPAERRHGMRM